MVEQLSEKINKLSKGEKIETNYSYNSIYSFEEKKNLENKIKEKDNEILKLKNEIENFKNNKNIPKLEKKFEFKPKKNNNINNNNYNNYLIKSEEITFSIQAERSKENE